MPDTLKMKNETKYNEKYAYYLRHPGQQFFFKMLAYIMGALGLSTEMWDWYKRPVTYMYDIQRYTVIIFVPITSLSETMYLLLTYKDHEFSVLAVMFAILPVTFVVLLKSIQAQTKIYKNTMRNFMNEMHLHNFLDECMDQKRYEFVAKQLISAERWTRRIFVFFSTLVMICYVSWHIVPIVHNIQNNPGIPSNITARLEVCIHLWQPFDYEFNFYAYLFIQIMGMYCGAVAVLIIVLFDTVNFSCVFHLVGHIKVLKYDLEFGFSDNMSDHDVKQALINITKYYRFIITSFKQVELAYGLSVLGLYAQNLIQGGLLLYQMMTSGGDTGTLLTFGLMIPIFMGILIIISCVLENIRIQADNIPVLLYDLKWESMSISNQRLLMSILFQVQPTLEFKAAFNTRTGIQPALSIIKTTFSYYVMIKARVSSD